MIVMLGKEQVSAIIVAGVQIYGYRELPERDVRRDIVPMPAEPSSAIIVARDQDAVGVRDLGLECALDLRCAAS